MLAPAEHDAAVDDLMRFLTGCAEQYISESNKNGSTTSGPRHVAPSQIEQYQTRAAAMRCALEAASKSSPSAIGGGSSKVGCVCVCLGICVCVCAYVFVCLFVCVADFLSG